MSQSIIYQFLKAGSQTITVPSGFSNQVLVYAWGAGGGSGTGAPGGGGGYAAGVVSISSGSTVIVSVGGGGGSTVGRTAAGSLAGLGNNPVIDLSGGVGAPGGDPEDNDAGGAGGGGGASAVFVNGIPMIVAAGAGGGGGLGEDWGGGDPENGKGRPGGVATEVNTVPRGADGRRGGAGGAGGGGAGYPFGGDSQRALYGDDVYSIAQGGFGGQNYANATVTSSSLVAGSGTNTAGTTNGYYPGKKLGTAGYDGCVILVFQKLFTAWIKKSGYWKQVTSAYVKTPDKTVTTYSTVAVPAGSVLSTSTETKTITALGASNWTVPTGVTSVTVTAIGGGGSGGTGGTGFLPSLGGIAVGISGGGGGGSSGVTIGTLAVTPRETVLINVGPGAAVAAGAVGGTTTVTAASGSIIATGGLRGADGTNLGGGGGGQSGLSGGGQDGTAGNFDATGTLVLGGAGGVNSTGYGSGGAGGIKSNGVTLGSAKLEDDNTGRIDPGLTNVYNFFLAHAEAFSSISAPTIRGAGTQISGVSYNAIATVRATLKSGYSLFVDDPAYGNPGHDFTNLTGPDTIVVTAALSNRPYDYTPPPVSAPLPGSPPPSPTIRVDRWGRSALGISSADTPAIGWAVYSSYTVGIVKLGGDSVGLAGASGAVQLSWTQPVISTSTTTTSVPTVRTVAAGGWKQIVRGWLKQNGVWENIATPVTLTPSKSETTPTRRAEINIVIATDTSSYNLIEVLNGTGLYYPGYSDITLTVNAGVTVTSDAGGTSALTVDGLTLGDSLIIVNNGTILGRGGAGGAGGSTYSYTVGSGKNQTTTNQIVAGGAGGAGGTALTVTYAATLENNGTIRAGGGGGGGGGVSWAGGGSGQGGGGAGYGPGANAGTLTTGGAGAANGGAGGASGANGTAGTNGSSYTYNTNNKGGVASVAGGPGGPGGVGGKAIAGYAKLTVTVTGTIVGSTA